MSIESFCDLEITFDKFDKTSMDDGKTAFIFYFDIFNKATNDRKIILHETNYITCEREQLGQDYYLSGYCPRESILKANTFQKAGFVFHTSKLRAVRNDDAICVSVELPKERKKVTLTFKKTDDVWPLVDSEQEDIEQLEKDLLNKIERIEGMEEKWGISLEAIYVSLGKRAYTGEYTIALNGEVHPTNGMKIAQTISIVGTFHDEMGRIIRTSSQTIHAGEFFGLQPFLVYFEAYQLPVKIRIYPTTQ